MQWRNTKIDGNIMNVEKYMCEKRREKERGKEEKK
jgi:hypothetical protein